MNTRYAVFAYDEKIGKFLEFIYANMNDCQYALDSFTEFDIQAFICVSDESMEGKIAEVLLTPGTCFNA
jgi:hypothetical protein